MLKFKNYVVLTVLIIFFFEVISFLFYKFNLLEISHIPKIYMLNSHVPNDEWWTEENSWGAWHKKSSMTRQKRSCFDGQQSNLTFSLSVSSVRRRLTNNGQVHLYGFTMDLLN